MNQTVRELKQILEKALSEESGMDKKELVDFTIDKCIKEDMLPELLEAMSQLLVLYNVFYLRSEKFLNLAESAILGTEKENSK